MGTSRWVALCNNDLIFEGHWATSLVNALLMKNMWSASPVNPNKKLHKKYIDSVSLKIFDTGFLTLA